MLCSKREAEVADLAILKGLGRVFDATAAIAELADDLQAKIEAIRKQYERADTEDEDLEAADDALLTIHGVLEDAISGLEAGQDELSTAVDFDELDAEIGSVGGQP
jgi:hypothetical protein